MATAFRIDQDKREEQPAVEPQPNTPCVGLFCFTYDGAPDTRLPANDQDWMRMFEVRG